MCSVSCARRNAERVRNRVRLWSRLAAGALVALAALMLLAVSPALREQSAVPGAGIVQAVHVALEQPDAPVRPVEREAISADLASDARGDEASDIGLGLRLWRYGARGEIVFNSADQYERCTEARRERREASDCPSARETAELRFAANEPLR